MTLLVVDASVAVKWLVEEPLAADATRLLSDEHVLHAPHLMAAEVANALWRKARAGEFDANEASTLMASIRQMPVNWAEDETISDYAVRLAVELDHPAYDCMYLALAHRLGARLVTADIRFANRVAATVHGSAVVRLSDYNGE